MARVTVVQMVVQGRRLYVLDNTGKVWCREEARDGTPGEWVQVTVPDV